MGNFERLEQLLLNKTFKELSAEERTFTLEAIKDEEEYNAMRNALLGSKKVFESDQAISSSVFSKRRLDDHFKMVHGSSNNNRLIITTIAATVFLLFGSWWLFNSLYQHDRKNYEVAENIEVKKADKKITEESSTKESILEPTQNNAPLEEKAVNTATPGLTSKTALEEESRPDQIAEPEAKAEMDANKNEVFETASMEQAPASTNNDLAVSATDESNNIQTDKISEKDQDRLAVEFLKNKKSESRSVSASAPAAAKSAEKSDYETKTVALNKAPEKDKGISLDEIKELENFFFACP